MSQTANFLAYSGFGGNLRVAAIDQEFRDLEATSDYLGLAIVTGAGPAAALA